MQFIRHGADPLQSLNIGPQNQLREFYQYVIGQDKPKQYLKATWQKFKYYSNNSYNRNQFNELYFNLLNACEKTGYTLSPQETRYIHALSKNRKQLFTDHDLILHLWFALPIQIKLKAMDRGFIQHYLDAGLSPIEGNVVCMGFYLTYVIFRVCSDELMLTKDERSPLRILVAHTYRQFTVN